MVQRAFCPSPEHPNIVTIHSIETAGDIHFLTMQLVEGRTLSKTIPKGGLTLARIFEIAVPLTDALAAAHAKGIVHRSKTRQTLGEITSRATRTS